LNLTLTLFAPVARGLTFRRSATEKAEASVSFGICDFGLGILDFGFRDPEEPCVWNILSFDPLEYSGILESGIRNPGILESWNPESWNPESGIWNPES